MLGKDHPDQLRADLTLRQENDWYWFLDHEPQGERREDWRAARLLAAVQRACGNTEADPIDYLLSFEPDEPDPADIHLKLQMVINRVRDREERSRRTAEGTGA